MQGNIHAPRKSTELVKDERPKDFLILSTAVVLPLWKILSSWATAASTSEEQFVGMYSRTGSKYSQKSLRQRVSSRDTNELSTYTLAWTTPDDEYAAKNKLGLLRTRGEIRVLLQE